MPRTVEPVRRTALVELLADLLRPSGSETTRFGVDGPVEADTTALADDVASRLAQAAVPVARVRSTDFLRARSLRLEYGRDDPESMYRGWYDVPGCAARCSTASFPAAAGCPGCAIR